MRRAGAFQITKKALAELLGFPEEIKIIDIGIRSFDDSFNGTLTAVIEGKGLPEVAEGQVPPLGDIVLEFGPEGSRKFKEFKY